MKISGSTVVLLAYAIGSAALTYGQLVLQLHVANLRLSGISTMDSLTIQLIFIVYTLKLSKYSAIKTPLEVFSFFNQHAIAMYFNVKYFAVKNFCSHRRLQKFHVTCFLQAN